MSPASLLCSAAGTGVSVSEGDLTGRMGLIRSGEPVSSGGPGENRASFSALAAVSAGAARIALLGIEESKETSPEARSHNATASEVQTDQVQRRLHRLIVAIACMRAAARLAVLYSGRFYGELTLPAWSKDHLDNLIVPNGAAVFVVVDSLNVCDRSSAVHRAVQLPPNESKWEAASRALLQEARAVFGGWPDLYAKLVQMPGASGNNVEKKFWQASSTSRALPSQPRAVAIRPWTTPVPIPVLADALLELSCTHDHAQAVGVVRALGYPGHLTNRRASMYNWEKQFELISQGMAFVSSHGGKPFDIVVRMRMVCCWLYRGQGS